MGSSYFPSFIGSSSYSATGPTGPKGETGPVGVTGYGPTGNTGISVSSMGLCGGKLRTNFNNGSTYETSTIFRGATGDTLLIAGISVASQLSIFQGTCGPTAILEFRRIRGSTSISGRAEFIVGLTGDSLYFDYTNKSSGLTVGITGTNTIRTFVGYSGSTLASIPKSKYDQTSSILAKNVFEKARGLGYSGATSTAGITCNYISGGTFIYIDSSGFSAATACKVVNIDPDCLANNSVDLQIYNRTFVADMKNNITIVKIGPSDDLYKTSAITVVLMNASNGPLTTAVGQKRFQVSSATGGIVWPFGKEPCFCGETGTNLYHFYNLGGYTWYGSVGYMTDPSKFYNCQTTNVILGLNVSYGACCVNDGSAGGTCVYETLGECASRGASGFWHAGLTCGQSPCAKTGGCCMEFAPLSQYSSLCLNGITCINCISGRVYDYQGNTYNAKTFTYLGNGITCSSSNCPAGAQNAV